MGDTGPCGPCSEILVDLHPERPQVDFAAGSDSGRYLEIWNLVFMQFDRDQAGSLKPLPNPSIDTGAGLERLSAVLQGVDSNYDTDLFQPILRSAAGLAGTAYGRDGEADVALRVIADHLRAVAFLLADGVIPGPEGRGYVLRRLLRRAVRHGMRLGFAEPFLHRLLPTVGEVLGRAYPEISATREASEATIASEEEKFLCTLAEGARQMQEEIEAARREGRSEIPGPVAFRLYDTLGLPLEVMREIAQEERFTVDEASFEAELSRQRERSRRGAGEGGKRLAEIRAVINERGYTWEPVRFHGHLDRPGSSLVRSGEKVLVLVRWEEPAEIVQRLAAGERCVAVFQDTPFYAEAGGQVGDRGEIRWPAGRARVTDTQKLSSYDYFHLVTVEEGALAAGAEVELAVDPAHRLPTQRNHTATHLLHAALRQVLGEGARQAGSLVAPDRLRFDFTFHRPLTAGELTEIEARVNRWVLEARATAITPERPYREALAAGAMALFGEKYGELVRTVEVPGVSLELCGGCHVANTGEIGLFLILGERGIASGVRRIEALTGEGARAWVEERRRLLAGLEASLGGPAERAAEEIARLRREVKEKEEELAKLRLRLVAGGAAGDGAASEVIEVDGVRLLAKEVPAVPAGEMRNMADALRGKLGSGVVVLGSRAEGKVSLVAAVTPDLAGRLHAGKLVGAVAARVGGGGGGRPDFAQAGGKEPEKLPEALAATAQLLREQLDLAPSPPAGGRG
jgi:alanyl-tRNA synthetase